MSEHKTGKSNWTPEQKAQYRNRNKHRTSPFEISAQVAANLMNQINGASKNV